MTPEQAHVLAAELAAHRSWRVENVSPAPASVLLGPAEGLWVRLIHRAYPDSRFVIPTWPSRASALTAALTREALTPHAGVYIYGALDEESTSPDRA